ncbi:MAG: RHS repeat-associated core domain-containing protein, partial [Sandaracinaceae bacterium]|nr:RHS repeat-associated core domain-containing protein [Sandaracinaceae bacterium]
MIESSAELTERATLDIRGLSEATIDRRALTVSTRAYDRLGRQLLESSADAGEDRSLFDAAGREVLRWREDTREARTYDLAGRLVALEVTHDSTTWLAERYTYGEGLSGAADRNQLGRLVLTEDAAGTLETTRYGAFGEPLEVERTLTATPGLEPDWSGSVSLESNAHWSRSVFDALGRRTRAWLPDGTERREEYLRSGPLGELSIVTPDSTTRTILVSAEHNARGQRTFMELGNGVEITNTYDDETFRLYRRHAVVPGTSTYQDLRHHYDPVGNLVYLDDLAQSPTADHVIDGLTVSAHRVFTHDTRYQLKSATGRVHEALTRPDFRGDTPESGALRGTRQVELNDGGVVARYRRRYTYDDAGNLEEWDHGPEPGGASITEWKNELWVSSTSNRSYPAYDLNDIAISDPEDRFNARGQIIELPNVREMVWNGRDQLRRTLLIEREGDEDDDEVYDYGADGARVRKTTRRLVSGDVEATETVYLDGCELRRITSDSTVILERWSAHAEAGDERLATIYFWDLDDLERETGDVDAVREHFHLGTQLGSVTLEVDGAGELLAYEEYFPYGRTAFLAGDSVIPIQFRTRRFVGKEQDDATGFYAFQFRYYAPFIGNWVSPDPAGEVDGPNRYWYARNNPVTLVDPDGLQATSGADFLRSDAHFQSGVPLWRDPETREVHSPFAPPPSAPMGRADWTGAYTADYPHIGAAERDQARESRARDEARAARQAEADRASWSDPEARAAFAESLRERLAGITSDISPAQGPDVDDPERQARQEQNARLLAGDSGTSLRATAPGAGGTIEAPAGGSSMGHEAPASSPGAAGDSGGGLGESRAPSARTGRESPAAPDLTRFWNQAPAITARDILFGGSSPDSPSGPPSVQLGVVGANGGIQLRDIPIPDDPRARRLVEESNSLRNEDRAARYAVGQALANGLTLGLLPGLQIMAETYQRGAQQLEAGDYAGLGQTVGDYTNRYLTPWGQVAGGLEMVAGMPAALGAMADALQGSGLSVVHSGMMPRGAGIDLRRLGESHAETPVARARQDAERGRTWSTPLQIGAEALGGALSGRLLPGLNRGPRRSTDGVRGRAQRGDSHGLTSRRTGGGLPDQRPRFDRERLRQIIRNLEAEHGSDISFWMDEYSEIYLDNIGASGAYRPHAGGGGGVVILRRNPARATVIEELLHLGQHRRTGFRARWGPAATDEALRRAQVIVGEMAAQEHLLRLHRSFDSRIVWTHAELAHLAANQLHWYREWLGRH